MGNKSRTITHNFSPGPSKLPDEVIAEIAEEFGNYNNLGISIIEVSHRSAIFDEILTEVKINIRKLMEVPDDYEIIFTPGGASMNFSMVAMNFGFAGKAAYIDTGIWSEKSYLEAKKFTEVNIPYTSKSNGFDHIPEIDISTLDGKYNYVHITTNNTIYGTQYTNIPKLEKTPLIADSSSDIMGRYIDVSQFGLIYAGLQKNLGPSGLGLVIIKKSMLDNRSDQIVIPRLLDYKTYIDYNSLFNTPNTFAIYAMNKVMKWLLQKGGVKEMEKVNRKKATLLYSIIDQSEIYTNSISPKDRSIMNVVFTLPDEKSNKEFIEKSAQKNLMFLKGHKSAGGIRASIYNAITLDSVKALGEFMEEFEKSFVK